MSVISKKQLNTHRHHRIILQGYHLGGAVLECLDCDEVLLEFHDDKFGMIQLGVHPEDLERFNTPEELAN